MYGYDQSAYGGHPQDPHAPHGQPPYGQPQQGGGYGEQPQYPQADQYQQQGGYGAQPHHDPHHAQQQAQHAQQQAQHQAAAQHQPAPATPLNLVDGLRAYTSGALATEDFQDIFWSAKVYCPRGDTPGFLAVQTTQEPVIPLFTSLRELRKYAGKESRYFTVTGGEVLDLLPHGYGFALDMEGEHRLVLDAKAVDEMTEYAMRRVYG
ncbi:SseB family protein [Streptomyces spiramenti]|uniref:SseB family protein n=1 Tax=Streptomyces spiramenti TaxID=2720606 RepID=A0ABX1AI70_9ACTN|nr:SseB family protein [Streptomyces spiramenti]NJP65361.1 SseB family protein [Streptomyces spiramenti]